jgi:transposase
LGRSGEAGRRLQAIISAKTMSITTVAEVYGITRATLMSWIRNFEAESTQGLEIKKGRGRKRLIDLEHEDGIKAMIKAKPNITIDELKLNIAEKYDVILGRTNVHRLMKRLSFSYITPRPQHYKANQEQQDGIKKNLREKTQKAPNMRLDWHPLKNRTCIA